MSGKYQFNWHSDGASVWTSEEWAYDVNIYTPALTSSNTGKLWLTKTVPDNAGIWLLFDVTHLYIKGNRDQDGQASVSVSVYDADLGEEVVIDANLLLSITGVTTVDVGGRRNCFYIAIKANNAGQGQGHFPFFLYDCKYGCVPDAAVCVSPADDEEDVAADAELNWTGEDAKTDTYKVYLGTDSPPTNIVNGGSQVPADPNTYTPAVNLDYATTYYWRIDAVNEAGTTQGTEMSFSTPSEFCRVYRGQDGVMDYNNPVALMGLADSQVTVLSQALPPDTIWHYIRRRVAPCELESGDSPVCVVRVDPAGDVIPAMPNQPMLVTVGQLAGGKFLVRWRYTSIDQEIAPTEFRIYVDSGSGFNFASPAAVVNYKLGGYGEFKWESAAYTHGQRVKFIVRAYAQGKGGTQNTSYVAADADALGPDAITDVYATVEQLA